MGLAILLVCQSVVVFCILYHGSCRASSFRFTDVESEGNLSIYFIDLANKNPALNHVDFFNQAEFTSSILAQHLLPGFVVFLKPYFRKCRAHLLAQLLANIMSSERKPKNHGKSVVMVNNCDMSCSVISQISRIFFEFEIFVSMCTSVDAHLSNSGQQMLTFNNYFPLLFRLTHFFAEALTFLNLTCVNIVTVPEVSIEEITKEYLRFFKKQFNGCVTHEIYDYINKVTKEEDTFSRNPTVYFLLMSLSDAVKYLVKDTNEFFNVKKIPLLLVGDRTHHLGEDWDGVKRVVGKMRRIILVENMDTAPFHLTNRTEDNRSDAPINLDQLVYTFRDYVKLKHKLYSRSNVSTDLTQTAGFNRNENCSIDLMLYTTAGLSEPTEHNLIMQYFPSNQSKLLRRASITNETFFKVWNKYPTLKMDICGMDGSLCKIYKFSGKEVMEHTVFLVLLIITCLTYSFLSAYLGYKKLRSGVQEWLITPDHFEDKFKLKESKKGSTFGKNTLVGKEQTKLEIKTFDTNTNKSAKAKKTSGGNEAASLGTRKRSKYPLVFLNKDIKQGRNQKHVLYQEDEVYVSDLSVKKISEGVFRTELLEELAKMKVLNHENLLPFVGLRMDTNQVFMLAARHGSLRDVIQDDCLKQVFNLGLMVSLLIDIAKGMDYLHNSRIGSHGHLRSSKCVIDSRWHCKISGYGLSQIRKNKSSENREEDMLYISPELLRTPIHLRNFNGTRTGDVYAFAVIMQEVILMERPYVHEINDKKMKITEILANVRSRKLKEPFRPHMGDQHPTEWRMVTNVCWNERPEMRFTFREIVTVLRKLAGNEQMTFAEGLSKRLQNNLKNLGAMVVELTKGVKEESEKAYNLLSCLLPKNVADDYILGKSYKPQEFKSATILCTDMKGFTKLTSKCTPRETIEFLNSLYSLYDEIVKSRDAYKLETIGDAYIVISGCPNSNGDRHASEICFIAIKLIQTAQGEGAPRLAGSLVGTRAGVHSGPVIAGVVGLKVPKFCVFGKSYFIAEKMESSSEENRIRVSEDTHKLIRSKDYTFEKSIEVDLPDGVKMPTYLIVDDKKL